MNTNIEIELDWFWMQNLKPVRRYGYPCSVEYRIFEADMNDTEIVPKVSKLVAKTFAAMWALLDKSNLDDNKIVIECELKNSQDTIFMGWKDGRICLGYGCNAWDNQEPSTLTLQEDGTILATQNEYSEKVE